MLSSRRDGQKVTSAPCSKRWRTCDLPPSPEYWAIVPLLLAYEQIIGIDLDKRLLVQDGRPLDAKFRSAFSDQAIYFSPFESLCDTGTCALLDKGTPVFFDWDHFTASGAKRMLQGFPMPHRTGLP